MFVETTQKMNSPYLYDMNWPNTYAVDFDIQDLYSSLKNKQ